MFRKMLMAFVFTVTALGCEGINPLGPILQIAVMWKQGEATKYYNTEQRQILAATRAAFEELGLPITSESEDGRTINMMVGDDDQFKVKVVAVRDKVTKLSIRVNTFGDRPYAEMVFRHVDKQDGVEQFMSVDELNEAVD